MDRGDWWATVHGVAKSHTRLKQFSTHARDTINLPNFNNVVSQGIGRHEERERDGGPDGCWSSQNAHNIYQLSLSYLGAVLGALKQRQ